MIVSLQLDRNAASLRVALLADINVASRDEARCSEATKSKDPPLSAKQTEIFNTTCGVQVTLGHQ